MVLLHLWHCFVDRESLVDHGSSHGDQPLHSVVCSALLPLQQRFRDDWLRAVEEADSLS